MLITCFGRPKEKPNQLIYSWKISGVCSSIARVPDKLQTPRRGTDKMVVIKTVSYIRSGQQ